MHPSIIQNIERVERKLFHWNFNSREHTNDSTSTNNKMAVDSLIIRFSVHLLRFHLEIHSFFEDKQWTLTNEEKVIGKVSLI